ncbi:MAG: hypothetical protein ACI8XO_000604 [Verrucomicrobiales bacterium]|jgi:hypothetical protein
MKKKNTIALMLTADLAPVSQSPPSTFNPIGKMMKCSLLVVSTLAFVLSGAQAELVSYWHFNGDATDATGAHDGTLVNGASISTGLQGFGGGEALSLGGGSGLANAEHMSTANPTTFDFDTDFTWHAYIKTTTNNGGIFGRAPAATIHNQGSKSLFLGGANVQWDTGWVGAPSSGVGVTDDNWHQVIVTFSAATDQLDIFVDPTVGATAGQLSTVHDVNRFDESLTHNGGEAETAFFIGLISDNFRQTGFVGLIDEAAVFDTALSGPDLDQLITDGPASFLGGGDDPNLFAPEMAVLAPTSVPAGSVQRSFNIRNSGDNEILSFNSVSFSGGDSGLFSNPVFPATVAAGEVGTVEFTFSPSVVGTFSTNAEIASNDPSSPSIVAVTIDVVLDPFLVAPAAVVLDNAATSEGVITRAVDISNSGVSQELNITAATFSGADGAQFSNPVIPAAPLAAGADGSISFEFDTFAGPGTYVANLDIASNSDGSPTTTVALEITVEAGSAGSLVAYWSFDSDASDVLGTHDGTLQNGASITSGSLGFGGGEALMLAGGAGETGPHVTTADPESFDFNSDFTWHAYVKTTSGAGGIFGRVPATGTVPNHNQGSKSLYLTGNNIGWDTGWLGAINTGVTVNDDEWHQVIATFVSETDELKIFVDPVVGGAAAWIGVHDVNRFDEHTLEHNGGIAHTSFRIGQISDNFRSESIDGLIDEAAVFDVALNGAQLDQLISDGPASFASVAPFQIREFSYSAATEEVTLTWDSKPTEIFTVVYSNDLVAWIGDLDDTILADAGETTTRSYNVSGQTKDGRLYIRVQRQN